MLRIGLDLATRTCGVSIYSEEEKKLLHYSSYSSKEKDYFKLQTEMVGWVFKILERFVFFYQRGGSGALVLPEHKLIIEDVYVGFDPYSVIDTARTQGAIIQKYWDYTNQYPIIISAISARKNIGLEANLTKVEYQLYTIDKFKLVTLSEELRGEIIRTSKHWEIEFNRLTENKKKASKIVKEKINKEIKKLDRESKNALNRLSTKVKNETGIDEHVADSIILALYKE